jgi:hypothetical protein
MESLEDKDDPRLIPSVFVAAIVVMAGGVFAGIRFQRAYRVHEARGIISRWDAEPKLTAALMIERYGPPDRTDASELSWFRRAPWKRVVVHSDAHQGPLEDVVSYDLDSAKADRVMSLGRGVFPDPANSELSAQGRDEWRNILALNMADEVATGERSPREARRVYDKTAQLTASGKSSGYTAGLVFDARGPAPRLWVKDVPY